MPLIKKSFFFNFLLLLMVATPLFATKLVVDNPGFDKAVWLFLVLDITLLLYFWLGRAQFKWRLGLVDWLVIAFAAALLLSTLFSVNASESFWGSFDRFEGFILFLHLFLFYFLLRSASEAGLFRWETLFNLYIGIATLVSVYALLERITPLGGLLTPIAGGRVSATLGNPNLLGGYLALTLILVLGQLWENKRLWLIYAAILVLQFAALLLSGSRASLIAFLIGAVIFAFYARWFNWRKWDKKLILTSLGIGVALIVFAAGFTNLGSRLMRSPWQDVSFKNRLNGWAVTLRAVPKRPLVGWGLEQYEQAFTKVYQPRFGQYVNEPTWFDRAHNVLISMLVQAGILGVLSYLALIFLPFYLIIRRRLFSSSLILAGGLVLVISFLQNLFNFDSISSYLVIFAVLAFLAGQLDGLFVKDSKQKLAILPSLALSLFALASIVTTIFLSLGYYQAVAADKLIKEHQFASAQAKLSVWVGRHPLSSGILRISSLFLQYRLRNDTLSEQQGKEAAELVRFMDERAAPMLDRSTRLTYTLASLNFPLAKLGSSAAFKVGNTLYQRALNQMPLNETLYWAWGRELAILGDWADAGKFFDKSFSLNSNFATAELWRALAFIHQGDFSDAQDALASHQKLVERGFTTEPKYLAQVAGAYIDEGRYDLAIKWYEERGVPEMTNLGYRFHLATLYFTVKNYSKAAEQLRYVLDKNPAYPGAQQFWQELKKAKPDLEEYSLLFRPLAGLAASRLL